MSENYKYILETEHVSKKFGSLEVLKDINLKVKKGEVICIIGPSGAGKSTYLRSLNQLENKEIDAVVCDSSVADSFLNKNSDKYKLAYRDSEEAEEFAIAISKDNEALKTAVDKALEEMKEDGVIDEIFDHWFVTEE